MARTRSISAVTLVILGGVIAMVANLAVWVDRTVYNTDNFVSTVDRIFQDEHVQQGLSNRISNAIVEDGTVEQRIQAGLPENLKFLAPQVTDGLGDVIQRAVLRLIEADRFQDAYQLALTALHSQVIHLLTDSDVLHTASGSLVIDLRPVVDSVVQDVGLEGVQTGIRDNGGARSQALADAGQIELDSPAAVWAYRIGHYGQDIVWIAVGVAIACFVLALLIATNRLLTVKRIGVALVAVGITSLLILVALRLVASQIARNPPAATSILSIVTEFYRNQSLVLTGVGALMVAGSYLLARRLDQDATEPGESGAGVIRAAVVCGAVLLLVSWTDASRRFQVTLLILVILAIAAAWLAFGRSARADSGRARVKQQWNSWFGASASAEGGWVPRHAGLLRLLGVVIAVITLLVIPTISFAAVVSVAVLLLAWLAVVEWLASRGARHVQPPPPAERQPPRATTPQRR